MKNINNTINAIAKETKAIGFDQTSDVQVGALLSTLVASKPDAKILELGTGSGLSTAWIAYGMDKKSHLITVDNDERLVKIAKKYLGSDSRIDFRVGLGEEVIDEIKVNTIDFIFADTWPGKYHYLDEALRLLKVGGIYVIDDMLPQANWPEGHDKKVDALIETLKCRDDLHITQMDWATGVIVCTKIETEKETNQWNPKEYNKHTAFVSQLALSVVALLNPQEDERILDGGCGDGTLAVEIEKYGAKVVGIDMSAEMIEACKAKGIEAYVASVTSLSYANEFDAVFSNATLHWVKDAKGAVENIAKSLKNGGRFVAEFGGVGNMHQVVVAMQQVFDNHPEFGAFENPWYFPSPEEYRALLESAGFEVRYIALIPRPTPMDDIVHWLDIFANGITEHLSKEQFEVFKSECRDILVETIYSTEEGWILDYVRLRVEAIKVL